MLIKATAAENERSPTESLSNRPNNKKKVFSAGSMMTNKTHTRNI